MEMTITVALTDADQAILYHDLLDIDVWIQAAVEGKIDNCRTHLLEEARMYYFTSSHLTTMPADRDVLIAEYIHTDGYRNRAEKDADALLSTP